MQRADVFPAVAFVIVPFHTPDMTEPLLGRSINRLEDERFVRGRGRYVADLAAPRRASRHRRPLAACPCAHRLRSMSMRRAQCPASPAVFTGADLAADDIGPLPCAATNIAMATPLVVPPCHALARDVVRYVGEPVAFVVAESGERARDAAEAVVVDYEPLAPVISIADAVSAGKSVDLATSPKQRRVRIPSRRDGTGGGGDPRRRPCRGMRTRQQPRGGGIAGNPRRARRIRRGERTPAPDGVGRRRACDPRPARGFRLPHPARKTARQHSRCRRRFRDEERALSGMGAGAVGGAAPEPSGAMDRRPQRGISGLRARPRQPAFARGLRSTKMASSSRSRPTCSPTWAPMSRRWRRSCRPWRWAARWAASTTFRWSPS